MVSARCSHTGGPQQSLVAPMASSRFPIPFPHCVQALSRSCGCILPVQGICDRRKPAQGTSLFAAGVLTRLHARL